MKIPLRNQIAYISLLLVTTFLSCQKDSSLVSDPSIAQAKAYFETHLQHQHEPSPQASRRQKTAKTPLWEQAYTTQLSIGTGIIVPLHYHSPLYTPLGKNKQPVSIDSLSYLLLYQSPQGSYQAEVITRLPEASYWDSKQKGPYTGHILVESWAGKPIKTIPYQRRPKVSPSTNAYYADQFCWDQVWTITVTAEGETHTYRETETFCITIQQGGGGGGGSDNGGGGGQGPSGNDYQEDPRHPRGGGGQRSPERPRDRNQPSPADDEQLAFLQEIDDSQLKPCMQAILADVKRLSQGSVAGIIKKFAGENPGYNWKLLDERLPQNINGQTSTQYDRLTGTVRTRFDSQQFVHASDLSIARTILHESIHAYLIAELNIDPIRAQTITYPELWQELLDAKDPNGIHHVEITNHFLNDIAKALREFGITRGYDLTSEFYQDMAWGGLTHDQNGDFQSLFLKSVPNHVNQRRIVNTISVEQSGFNLQGALVNQKGELGGC